MTPDNFNVLLTDAREGLRPEVEPSGGRAVRNAFSVASSWLFTLLSPGCVTVELSRQTEQRNTSAPCQVIVLLGGGVVQLPNIKRRLETHQSLRDI